MQMQQISVILNFRPKKNCPSPEHEKKIFCAEPYVEQFGLLKQDQRTHCEEIVKANIPQVVNYELHIKLNRSISHKSK